MQSSLTCSKLTGRPRKDPSRHLSATASSFRQSATAELDVTAGLGVTPFRLEWTRKALA